MSTKPTEPDDWSRGAEALFRSARDAHAPSAVDRERVRVALAQKLATATAAPAADDAPARLAHSGMSRAALGKLTKIGLGVTLALAGTAAFMRANDTRERTEATSRAAQTSSGGTPSAQHATESAVAVGDTAANSSVARAPAAAAPRARGTQPARSTAQRSMESPPPAMVPQGPSKRLQPSTLDQPASAEIPRRLSPAPAGSATSAEGAVDARAELEFVARINAAVRGSPPQTVLALCAEHERRWPHGIFEQEREGARALASCSSKLPDAKARARAFLATYPRTAISARVREECAFLLVADTEPPR